MHCTDISLKYQYCRAAVGMGIPMESPVGIWYGMGMGTVMNLDYMGLWGFCGDFRMDVRSTGNALNTR